MTIGERIKQLREQNGLTPSELAYFVDGRSTYVQLTRWERDSIEPRICAISKICKVFRISLSQFFEGVDLK